MATIFDITSWDVVSESILASVGDLNLTIVTTDFNGVATVEVPMPADVAVVDVGVVGLGNQPGSGGEVDSVNGQTGIVSLTQDNVPDGTTHKQYSATEKTKLAGVATGATANDTDANLKNRANHTGSQAISTVTGLQTAIDGKAAVSHSHAESDITGLTADLAAKAPLASPAFTGTPTGITKTHVGLGNVDNTADSAKPVSTAQQTALDGKQNLDSDLTAIAALTPTNDDIVQRKAGAWTNRTPAQVKTDLALTKTDVGLANVDNTADTAKPVSSAQQTALDGKQGLDSDLTAIAGLSPTNDDIIQRKSGAWTNRTPAQVKTDLAIGQSDVSGLSTLLGLAFYFADGTTSTNARPSVPGKVIWVGGTTQPVNMATGDLWVKA